MKKIESFEEFKKVVEKDKEISGCSLIYVVQDDVEIVKGGEKIGSFEKGTLICGKLLTKIVMDPKSFKNMSPDEILKCMIAGDLKKDNGHITSQCVFEKPVKLKFL